MSYRLRLTPHAADDLLRLFEFMAERDLQAAGHARTLIAKSFEFLQTFPFACRKASADHPFLRELVIDFGHTGFVALYEIETNDTVTILAVRHQREDDFY
ncbi:MAG: type II toxin-antitoxin system RelE/ParE family toxin [Rubrivivax sp.]|nr:type II toxin-antitoxin system RelE/ParE family toxin [Rubrivivax sp.]